MDLLCHKLYINLSKAKFTKYQKTIKLLLVSYLLLFSQQYHFGLKY